MDTNDGLNNATNKNRSSNLISHTLDIVKAAFPYLDSDSQQSLDLIIKMGEVWDSFQSLRQRDTVTTFSLRKQSIDLEALLTNVREVCYDRERDLVDMILNMIKAKNLYDTYVTLTQTMASQSDYSDNQDNSNSTNTSGGMFGMGGNSNMMEILSSLLTPEQKSTFDNINLMFNTMQYE
ncbi:MAG: hypothetical protein K0S41_1811 [Anaerocolumna sp.]|jgi:hypothetical protein|nr:hypothetical protein [Anaerocolumna sp.]